MYDPMDHEIEVVGSRAGSRARAVSKHLDTPKGAHFWTPFWKGSPGFLVLSGIIRGPEVLRSGSRNRSETPKITKLMIWGFPRACGFKRIGFARNRTRARVRVNIYTIGARSDDHNEGVGMLIYRVYREIVVRTGHI